MRLDDEFDVKTSPLARYGKLFFCVLTTGQETALAPQTKTINKCLISIDACSPFLISQRNCFAH
jgi:hypothetical protein